LPTIEAIILKNSPLVTAKVYEKMGVKGTVATANTSQSQNKLPVSFSNTKRHNNIGPKMQIECKNQ
jgi:hypothetical protein